MIVQEIWALVTLCMIRRKCSFEWCLRLTYLETPSLKFNWQVVKKLHLTWKEVRLAGLGRGRSSLSMWLQLGLDPSGYRSCISPPYLAFPGRGGDIGKAVPWSQCPLMDTALNGQEQTCQCWTEDWEKLSSITLGRWSLRSHLGLQSVLTGILSPAQPRRVWPLCLPCSTWKIFNCT